MKTRLLTSFGIILVLAIAFILKVFVSDYFFDALILLIACFAAYEASKLFVKMGKYNNTIVAVIYPVFLMLILLLCSAYDSSIGIAYTLVIAVASMVLFFGITFIIPFINYKATKNELRTRNMDKSTTVLKYALLKALNTAVVFLYPAFLLLFLTLINHFEDLSSSFTALTGFDGWVSFFVLLFSFLIPIFTDTFAYLMGGLFGGKKLAPKISPNKTISGAIGGTVWCVLLTVAIFFILDSIPSISTILLDAGISVWKLVIISFIGSIISQLGDLFESYLKRSASVKDSGNLLPGHGGMLDRFDSYVFVAPFMFTAFSILFLVL